MRIGGARGGLLEGDWVWVNREPLTLAPSVKSQGRGQNQTARVVNEIHMSRAEREYLNFEES